MELSGGTFLKHESDRFGLPAFKILGASWAVERTLRGAPGRAHAVAASAGNHGRAVARAAAWRGLWLPDLLPARAVPARADAIAGEGAEVVRVDGGYEDAVEASRAERGAGSGERARLAYVAPAVRRGWAIDGYSTLFREADAQAGRRSTWCSCPSAWARSAPPRRASRPPAVAGRRWWASSRSPPPA